MKEDIKFNSPNFSKSLPSILMNERYFDSWNICINVKSSIFILLLNTSRNHIKWNGGEEAAATNSKLRLVTFLHTSIEKY